MKSATATSFELDDAQRAVLELSVSLREKLDFLSNSIGILLCDADTDGATVSALLSKELGIPIAGMTTLATLDSEGHHEGAVVLTVLTADDVEFKAAVSVPLDGGYEQQLVDTFKATIPEGAAADAKPAVIFAFCPNGEPFSGDKYPETLAAVTGNAPIIGGVSSDDYDMVRARVFLDGEEYKDSLVLVSVWGNVHPIFSIRHVTSQFAERIRRVVHSKDNIVYKVGDETFVEYLEGFDLKTDVPDVLLAFNSYPMMLTREDENETPLMRHIAGLDLEKGTGTFFGDVPSGTLANICLVNKEDIKVSARESMKALLEQMEQHEDYEHSLVLCISCCGRAMILGMEGDAEGEILSGLLPQGMALTGAYCLGEICPTRYVNGEAINRFHNCSITMCAL